MLAAEHGDRYGGPECAVGHLAIEGLKVQGVFGSSDRIFQGVLHQLMVYGGVCVP